ncbi:MAG: ABC transporter substrate-binding protein [Oscillospiraceae bacterium]
MKKFLAAFLSAMMVVSMFAGCTKKENTPTSSTEVKDEKKQTEPVEITYWQHSSTARDEMMQSIADDFTKANPDIKVKMEFIPEADYNNKLIPALATATAPDVFQIQSGMIAQLAKSSSIQPLDESVMSTQDIQNQFIPATVDGLKYDGKYYGMPTDTQTVLMFWNKGLFKAAGLDPEKGPQTTDELFDLAKKLTKYEKGAMVQSGWGHKGYAPEITSLVEMYGGKFYDASANKFVFADDANAMKAINDTAALIRGKEAVYTEQFMKNWAGFREGKVAMMIGHPAMIGNLKTTAPDVDYGLSLLPTKDGKRAACVTSWGYVMSKKANSVAATKFIDFLSSEAVEKKWTLKTGELPARKALLEDAELTADAKVKLALGSLNESFVGPIQTSAMNGVMKKMYEEIMLTDKAIEAIAKDYQAKLNAEVSK